MKKLLLSLSFIMVAALGLMAQDTVIVQTLTYDSTTRGGIWDFPSDTNSWRKVILQYSMRCHDALVGNANGIGCFEWDYSCNTVIVDSSRTDSIKATSPSHSISNFSGSIFPISFAPTYSYYDYVQHNVSYSGTISENAYGVLGTSPAPQAFPLGTAAQRSRSQFLWTATELSGQGLTAGLVTSLRLNMATLGSPADFMRIKIKPTTATTLDANAPQLTGFTEVYFTNTSFPATGWQQFNFYNPYTWNGTDNLIVEISYRNAAPGTNNQVNCYNTGANLGIVTTSRDHYLEFSGSEYVDVDAAAYGAISNEITVSFWSYGGANLPANTGIFEGTNAAGARQTNVHLPWSDGSIYWDCGADPAGYDRINKPANAADYRGRWTHWAFTKNATTGDMKIYMDGTLWHSGTGKTKPIDIENFRIGSGLGCCYAFSGKVNEFQVFAAELDGPTIRDWMYKDLTPAHPDYASLVAYYQFDEGSGPVITDASPNATTSLISGAPVWGEVDAAAFYRNFAVTQQRPQAYFVRGTYTTTNDNQVVVRDSVIDAQHRVIGYTVQGTDLVAVDTNYYFQSGWQYVYDAQTGAVLDSMMAGTDSSITVTTLTHYPKSPARYEIMSFVTPYGNGLDLGPNGVMWEFDMTDFVPILHGRKRMYMTYGGENQEEIDIRFVFIRGTPPRDVMDIRHIWPMTATNMQSIHSNAALEPRNVTLMPGSAAWKIRSTITGHGQEGEFIGRWHFLNLNGGSQEQRWRVWKECSDMPVYPQGGTWLYDRAGWCPGVPSDLLEYELGAQGAPGSTVEIDYGMDVVSGIGDSRYLVANQLVTYGAPNFSLDAALVDVKRPATNVRYRRFNPACNLPVVIIRNEGTTPLDSVDIIYNQQGGPTRTYRWRGSLEFLQSAEVTLPVDNANFWTGTGPVFEVALAQPNGGTDQQPENDSYQVQYNAWDLYTGTAMDFYWKTNNQPSQNVWRLYDEAGTVLLQSSPFLTANTTYSEVFNLPEGCYTLQFTDLGDDGLYYWAAPSNGSGFARMREDGTLRKTFNPEFGRFFKYDFWTDGTLVSNEVDRPELITIYPNPSAGLFYMELQGFMNTELDVQVYDMTGRVVWQRQLAAGGSDWQRTEIDLSHCARGNYILKFWDGHELKVRDLVKQ